MPLDGPAPRAFDEIICLGGEDWWYHNRGHFDFQILRRIARHCPVLFVNSLGVRMPTIGRNRDGFGKIWRKLNSVRRGLQQVEPNFWVYSPISTPGLLGARLTDWALARQIIHAARHCEIDRSLLWIHCPTGARLIGRVDASAVVLQRTDRFEESFPEGDAEQITRQIEVTRLIADLVIYASPQLAEAEQSTNHRSLVVTHGVDLGSFTSALHDKIPPPADVAAIPRKRVGFVGGIDAHTFDPALFNAVVELCPDLQFVLVGACSLPDGWCSHPNVHQLGRKPYELIAATMTAMDVLIMPWNQSTWIEACSPVKLKEYIATGLPIVSTDFPSLDGWRDLVHVAHDAPTFANALRYSLAEQPRDHQAIAERLELETWEVKADLVMRELEAIATASA